MRPGQPQLHPQLNGSLDLDGAFGERAMCRTAISSRFVAAAALAESSVVPCFYHLAPPWWCPCRSQHWQCPRSALNSDRQAATTADASIHAGVDCARRSRLGLRACCVERLVLTTDCCGGSTMEGWLPLPFACWAARVLIDAALQAQHGDVIAQVRELERAVEIASHAVEAVRTEIAPTSACGPAHIQSGCRTV